LISSIDVNKISHYTQKYKTVQSSLHIFLLATLKTNVWRGFTIDTINSQFSLSNPGYRSCL